MPVTPETQSIIALVVAMALNTLQGFERVVQSARPELFLVSGYSGIGKSSVVHELHKPVVRQHGFFLSGKFDQLQRGIEPSGCCWRSNRSMKRSSNCAD